MSIAPRGTRTEPEKRLARVLRLLLALQQEQLTRMALAQRFGVSERQVQRDLDALRAAGIQLLHTRKGYRVVGWPS